MSSESNSIDVCKPETSVEDTPSSNTQKPATNPADEVIFELTSVVSSILSHISTEETNQLSEFVTLLQDKTTVSEGTLDYLKNNATNDGDDFVRRLNKINPFLEFTVSEGGIFFKQKDYLSVDLLAHIMEWVADQNYKVRNIEPIEIIVGTNFIKVAKIDLSRKSVPKELSSLDAKFVDGIKKTIGEFVEIEEDGVKTLNEYRKGHVETFKELLERPARNRVDMAFKARILIYYIERLDFKKLVREHIKRLWSAFSYKISVLCAERNGKYVDMLKEQIDL